MSADYRLLPEASGLDILGDLDSLWEWVFSGLQKELAPGIEVDLDKILLQGESAGIYLQEL